MPMLIAVPPLLPVKTQTWKEGERGGWIIDNRRRGRTFMLVIWRMASGKLSYSLSSKAVVPRGNMSRVHVSGLPLVRGGPRGAADETSSGTGQR